MPSTDGPERLALRPREAAKLLGVCEKTLWNHTQPRGPIPCVRLGRGKLQVVRYGVDDLRAWLRDEAAKGRGGAV